MMQQQQQQQPAGIKRPTHVIRNVQQQHSFLRTLIALLFLSSASHLPAAVADFNLQFAMGRHSLKKRKRARIEDMVEALGPTYFRRAYRMEIHKFYELVTKLSPQLKKRRVGPNGRISVALQVSAALRYFAGGSPYDLMVTHGLSHSAFFPL
jgi:hypothetical protein